MTVISISRAMADRVFARCPGSAEVPVSGDAPSGQADDVIGPTEAPTYNCVGIIRGTDLKRRNSYVGIGLHHDHIGRSRPLEGDSIRAVNAVVRVRAADDGRISATSATAACFAVLSVPAVKEHEAAGRRTERGFISDLRMASMTNFGGIHLTASKHAFHGRNEQQPSFIAVNIRVHFC